MKKIVPPYTLSDFNLNDRFLHKDETVVNLINAVEFLLEKENNRHRPKPNEGQKIK